MASRESSPTTVLGIQSIEGIPLQGYRRFQKGIACVGARIAYGRCRN